MTPALPLRFSEILSPGRTDNIPAAWTPSVGGHPPLALTLGRLRGDALRIAATLAARPENRWALCFEDTWWLAASFLAALHTGKAVVLPGHTREALLLEQRHAFDALLTDLPIHNPALPCLHPDACPEPGAGASFGDFSHGPDCPGVTFHTSGSTGSPKAVHKTLAALQRENDTHAARWGAALAGTAVAGTTSHQHLYGFQFRMLLPLTLGVPFNTRIIEYHEQLLHAAPRPFALITSPAFIKRLDPALPPLDASAVRHVLSAGGFLSPDDAGLCLRVLGRSPFEIYGSTEAGAIAWRDTAVERRFWTPLPGVRLRCDSADGRLSLTSPFLPPGQTLVTDDQIRPACDPAAGIISFELLGRLDRIIKIEEKRVSLPEIEQRLLSLDSVDDAAVVPLSVPSPSGRARLQLGTVLVLSEIGRARYNRDGHGAFLLALRRELRAWLEPVALPRRLHVADVVPATPQGKRPASLLAALFAPSPLPSDSPALAATTALPSGATEAVIDIPLHPDLLWFRGHFPRLKLLPGVAQLHWVLQHAARAFGLGERLPRIESLKFRRPVLPGETLRMHLRWTPEANRLDFTATVPPPPPGTEAASVASTGRLTLIPATPPPPPS